jgi:integrase
MLSFYLCGINFKDMLYAQKEDIQRGRLEIYRIKTGQPLSIKIEPEAMAIIEKYPGDEFMLRILEEKLKAAGRDRKTIIYKDVTDLTNRNLKKIADDLGIPDRLSTYHARHTWSSIAFNECGANEEIIALALGHASQKRVTAGYIRKKYDQVDMVNRAVIDAI